MLNYHHKLTSKVAHTLYFTVILCIFYDFQPLIAQSSMEIGPVIVLDAGHGGKDIGASSDHAKEKNISLSVVQKVGWILNEQYPSAAIYYTRNSDDFVPLYNRAQFANDLDADLFISIHCNSLPTKNATKRGTETYVMGLHKAEENLQVAKRENAIALSEDHYNDHYGSLDLNSTEAHILLSQYQSSYLENSLKLANALEFTFKKRHPGKSNGVKQAGFILLHQIAMPGVLTEIGYLSHPEEEKYLNSEQGQFEIAEMIADGIMNYFNVSQVTIHKPSSITQPNLSNEDKSGHITMKGAPKELVEEPQKLYKVQIAASKDILLNSKNPIWLKAPAYSISKEGAYYKYLVGRFESKEQAEIEKENLRNLGFKDAYVVAYLGEMRVKE